MVSTIASTVAVEILLDDRPHIVGGRLAQDAILLRAGKKCDLEDFEVGEIVKIAWHTVDNRKEIVTIISDTPPAPPTQPVIVHKDIDTAPTVPGPEPNNRVAPPERLANTTAMIGQPQHHVVSTEDTLLDIARQYNLGYNEIADMYPDLDPWLPPVGRRLLLPTARLLPDGDKKGIVINVPEMRLYYFSKTKEATHVITHPVGIGDTDFQTEPGNYVVGNKAINPTWYIPPSLRAKYQVKSVPPGPDNPLGKYWLGLKNTNYGIHGSDIPWSIGRKVTHGCIRMYPEDISTFFNIIGVGTTVQIVYEPVKIGRVGNDIYLEVHKDIYNMFPDLSAYAREKLIEKGYWMNVDRKRFTNAIQQKRGIPENISYGARLTANASY
ncbi:L,D-transpeptidase family protein [Desulfopila aestuarii]|uniref:L,D-transpeptidase family protein n=1 Tax=Desulfopila aestuarii TaxID=231440 RepID=UPI0013563CFD|nr:L,D-transpeptidase family protein [Desulfopila aestuarii]